MDETQGNDGKLSLRVLMLNKLYSSVKVIPARRAFTMLYKNSAEIIHQNNGTFYSYDFPRWIEASSRDGFEKDDFVHTPNFRIKVPRVIRLMSYNKVPRRELSFSRKNILVRDGNRCQYCGKKCSVSQLSVDHIVPRSRGGNSSWNNMVACCNRCNTRKGGYLPQEVGMKLIKKPCAPTSNLTIVTHLQNKRYQDWKAFLDKRNV